MDSKTELDNQRGSVFADHPVGLRGQGFLRSSLPCCRVSILPSNFHPARATPSSGACHAALQRAVTGVLLAAIGLTVAGCEFEASTGIERHDGTNETESVKAELKMDGGL